MSGIIPDPENPEKVALDEDGSLVYGVFIAPVGTDPLAAEGWTHAGWSKGVDISGDDETPPDP